jgi:sugar transferase (PEP-CTERM/EpsH1 system associated)
MVYRREGGRLLAFDRRAAAAFDTSFFVTPAEAQLFRGLAPESAAKVSVLANGVDAEYFSPDPTRESPYPPDRRAIVFTGAMNYWPNVEAVTWFAREMLPRIRAVVPDAWFYVVGMSPAPAVQRLTESAGIVVTGTVRDVRPYLQHAGVVVAPLRLARGIQNKILEAMAMEKAVVASVQCAESLSAVPHLELEIADTADSFVQSVTSLLADDRAAAIGAAARRRVLLDYDWDRNLAAIDEALSPSAQFAGGGGDPIMPHPRTFASFGATERSGAA